MVPQCTTSDPATTAAESTSSAATPTRAGRIASVTHTGRPARVSTRGPTREPTPMSAPSPCTAATAPKAPSAAGVCSSVMTDEASWMTASATAATSSGPPTAEATIQRVTNHDPCAGVMRAVSRAVAQTMSAAGTSGSTPICWPATVTGTRWTASHILATAPRVPVRSLLATTSCSRVIAAMTTRATRDGPNATRTRSRGCGAPGSVRDLSCIRGGRVVAVGQEDSELDRCRASGSGCGDTDGDADPVGRFSAAGNPVGGVDGLSSKATGPPPPCPNPP